MKYGILAIRSGLSILGAAKLLTILSNGKIELFDDEASAKQTAELYQKMAKNPFLSYVHVPVDVKENGKVCIVERD